MKKLGYFCLMVCFGPMISCQLGERLDVRDMGDAPGYFLECYCQPGEMYEMTATRIAPIAEAQVLDYSLKFDVRIWDGEEIKLNHSLFTKPGTDFIYNYATSHCLDPELTDTIYLCATAPGGEKLTAKTAVPEAVKIDTVILERDCLQIFFKTSVHKEQNFYALTVNWNGEGKKYGHIRFLDGYTEEQWVRYELLIPEKERQDSLVVGLKRMTEEGFKYQYSLHEANMAGNESMFLPVELSGNISGALGIFTCYTADRVRVK